MHLGESWAPATARVLTFEVWIPRMPMKIVGLGWLMTASTKRPLPA